MSLKMDFSENSELKRRRKSKKHKAKGINHFNFHFDVKPMKLHSAIGNKLRLLLKKTFSAIPERWQNWIVRTIFAVLMISGFCLVISKGAIGLISMTLVVQVACFMEIINIAYTQFQIPEMLWFRLLSWHFLFVTNFFLYGSGFMNYLSTVTDYKIFFQTLALYHKFISFWLYCIGFIWFVLSLVKKYYLRQFTLFAWIHLALLVVCFACSFVLQSIFDGIIWFIVPISMIVCNDLFAYIFGFFYGKTPLIEVSPKKTWEGFIGGGISTVIFGLILSYSLCSPYFVCPVKFSGPQGGMIEDCEPEPIYKLQHYELPQIFSFLKILGISTIQVYPFLLHSFSFSIFTSVIAPFGGFFASGFKRAFKIKDFSNTIPGHGGIIDRCDCQFLMAMFVNVYLSTFIRPPTSQKVLSEIYTLKYDDKMYLYNQLKETLDIY